MNRYQDDPNRRSETKDHASLKPTQTQFPQLKEKLDYLLSSLGMTQQALADQLDLTKGAISQWKTNGIPKSQISALCRLLGISREELEIPDLASFQTAVENRFDTNAGARWLL